MTDDLRRLAEQATPGPWWHGASHHGEEFWYGSGYRSVGPADDMAEDVAILSIDSEADAAYIAAANPQAITKILDRVAALEEGLRAVVEAVDHNHDTKNPPAKYLVPWAAITSARALLASGSPEVPAALPAEVRE